MRGGRVAGMKSTLLHLSNGLAALTAATARTAGPACAATRTRAASSSPQGGVLSNLPVRPHGAGRLNEAKSLREPSLRSVPLPRATQPAPACLAGPGRTLAGKRQGLQPKPLHQLTLERLNSTRAPDDDAAAFAARLHALHRPVTGAATALIQAELRLPEIYTMLAAPAARERHGHHQEALAQALAELKARPRADGLDFRDIVARELPGLLRKVGFDAGIYAARNSEVGGYGRYLLHSDPDPKERFCLQIFAFEPRQKTPIHNHPNECASYIAQGTLMERVYELPQDAADAGHAGQVAKLQKNERPQASWAGFDLTQLLVPHSLKNKGDSLAVSVHLYRDMDGVTQGQQVATADKFARFKP